MHSCMGRPSSQQHHIVLQPPWCLDEVTTLCKHAQPTHWPVMLAFGPSAVTIAAWEAWLTDVIEFYPARMLASSGQSCI